MDLVVSGDNRRDATLFRTRTAGGFRNFHSRICRHRHLHRHAVYGPEDLGSGRCAIGGQPEPGASRGAARRFFGGRSGAPADSAPRFAARFVTGLLLLCRLCTQIWELRAALGRSQICIVKQKASRPERAAGLSLSLLFVIPQALIDLNALLFSFLQFCYRCRSLEDWMNPFFCRLARFVFVAAILYAPIGNAQEKAAPAPRKLAIRAGHLIDGKSDTPIANALILIEGDKIVSVTPGGTPPAGVEFIDLSR